jgi:hypothetical protein
MLTLLQHQHSQTTTVWQIIINEYHFVLKSLLRKVYGCHHDLGNRYRVSVSQMITVVSSFMIYHRVCNRTNMTGITCGAGTEYPSRATEITSGF